MTVTDHKDLFAQAYVRAVAAVAGFVPGGPELDRESCDLQLSSSGGVVVGLPPRMEIQIKGTAAQPVDGELVFDLKQKNYDDLRYEPRLVPIILVVVVMPAHEPASWLNHTDQELVLRRCGYWKSLRGQPASGNDTTTRIRVATNQRFDVAALTAMMNQINRGVFP